MRTIEMLNNMIQNNRDEYREFAAKMRTDCKTLETIYRENIDGTPAETVRAYVNAVGYDAARAIIYTLINQSAWDGRISGNVAAAAAADDLSWSEDAAERLWIRSDIHRAHLDQIARAMMEYEPAETNTEDAAEPVETVADIAARVVDEANAWNKSGAYNYRLNIKADILQYIADEIDPAEYADADALAEYLNDELWINDAVTGNASGSYTFNRWRASQYVVDNMDLLADCMNEYGYTAEDVGKHFFEL